MSEMLQVLKSIENKLDANNKMTQEMHRCLFGSASVDGLKVRVDRIEQTEDRRKWAVRTLGVGMAGMACTAIWTWFKGGIK